MKLSLIELNEINFDLVNRYLEQGLVLRNFQKLLLSEKFCTVSEAEHIEVEPWIQWPSVHTGLKYEEHDIFRLGDVVSTTHKQIFEKVEALGYKVGVLSAMNARNDLAGGGYFIPDPWTVTKTSKQWYVQWIANSLRQAVNDNSEEKLSVKTVLGLSLSLLYLLPISRLIYLSTKLPWALSKKWRKALFLDMLLCELFFALNKKEKVEFGTVFFNAGAHIQHHYLISSSIVNNSNIGNPDWYVEPGFDPLREALLVYDQILKRFYDEGYEFILATGLSQDPVKQPVFYYRLKSHDTFLKLLGIEFLAVFPRMTRDFLIKFDNNAHRDTAAQKLREIKLGNCRVFDQIEYREKELFVVSDYPHEIVPSSIVDLGDGRKVDLYDEFVFVALKNGEHNPKGYVFFSDGIQNPVSGSGVHVCELHNIIYQSFLKKKPDR